MSKHRHRPQDGTAWGYSSPGPIPPCDLQRGGRPCNTTGAHVSVACASEGCSAYGVMCPLAKRIRWLEAPR